MPKAANNEVARQMTQNEMSAADGEKRNGTKTMKVRVQKKVFQL